MAGGGYSSQGGPSSPGRRGPPQKVQVHSTLRPHMAQVGASVYCVTVCDKLNNAGGQAVERRFLIATPAWLFAMAPNGAVKRCWGWADVQLMVLRDHGRVVELLVRESGEKDLVLRTVDGAPENSHPSATDALEQMERVSRPLKAAAGRKEPLVRPQDDARWQAPQPDPNPANPRGGPTDPNPANPRGGPTDPNPANPRGGPTDPNPANPR
eukprot:gene10001-60807_t